MLRKRNILHFAGFFCAIAVILLAGSLSIGRLGVSSALGESWDTGETPGKGYLVSQGIKSKIAEMRSVVDLDKEAESKGFRITNIPQQIFTTFEVMAKGTSVARVPIPLYGTTTEGVVYLHTILPTSAPRDGADVFVWKNGKQFQLKRAAKADSAVAVQLPLDKGPNYLSFLIKSGNQWWGRSRVLRVESPGVEEKVDPPPPASNDFWDEANSKGFNMPKKDSIMGFIGMTVTGRGNVITDLPQPLAGSTSEGVVDTSMRLPNNLPGGNNQVFLWNNGEETLVSRNGRSGSSVLSKIIMGRGNNYVCATIKNGSKYIGRSPMMRINSSTMASIARFEMTWDGPGDMDLHLDSEQSGWRINFVNTNLDQGGNRANLDVDNMSGYGPENIRVFSLPRPTSVRCFVNFYSGGSTVKVTVRHFDKNNKMVNAVSKTFTPGMTRGTSAFNENSWVVGNFDIAP